MKRWARKSVLWKRGWDAKNRELGACVKYYGQRIEDLSRLEENVRNNNAMLEQLKVLNNKMETEKKERKIEENAAYGRIDYFDFENRFRGSREYIKEVQKQYIPYYKNCKNVIDLGSGRGEFLELLKENGIAAAGVEHYKEFVELCRKKGLEVVEEDVISYLERCDKKDGIFAGQLIEHLTIEKVISLCSLSYEKLLDGAYMILETPNPMSLSIYTHSFYIDPSHTKPVHPLTLQYIVEKIGFREIEILYTNNSKYPVEIPELKGEGIENIEEFNKSMAIVSNTLFGSQDYALIARK